MKTNFRERIFEISFNIQDPIPAFKDRKWQGNLTLEEVKDLWIISGCTEEKCEEIIREWEQATEWWGDGHIYFNYLFVRPTETNEGLIKIVDEMEAKGVMLFPDLSTEELKAILDDIEENIPDDVGIEVVYGKIYEEYHCKINGERIPAPRPVIDYESNLVFDISYFLNELQNDSYFLWNQKQKEKKLPK